MQPSGDRDGEVGDGGGRGLLVAAGALLFVALVTLAVIIVADQNEPDVPARPTPTAAPAR